MSLVVSKVENVKSLISLFVTFLILEQLKIVTRAFVKLIWTFQTKGGLSDFSSKERHFLIKKEKSRWEAPKEIQQQKVKM